MKNTTIRKSCTMYESEIFSVLLKFHILLSTQYIYIHSLMVTCNLLHGGYGLNDFASVTVFSFATQHYIHINGNEI